MNKKQFVELISKKTGISKSTCNIVIEQMKHSLIEICSKGGKLSFRGFGNFKLKERKQRLYINPQTKRYYFCQPKRLIDFKCSDGII